MEGNVKITEFETFREIGTYWIHDLTQKKPSAFNGMVNILKYKVTIEIIEEDKEIYRERLQKLWEECDNYHMYEPLKKTAEKFGINLKDNFGSKRKLKG